MRVEQLGKIQLKRRLDQILVMGQSNIRALTGVDTDNGILTSTALYTDFRYIAAARRTAPGLKVADIRRFRPKGARIGCEFSMPHDRFLKLQKKVPRAKLVDVDADLRTLREIKTPEEQQKLRAAERLACEIWNDAREAFRPGMTEREMAAIVKKMMIDRGDGEAFPTIVCVGANAAECHHEPDETIWDGREPVLVDMGVKLNGVCSDLTRNIVPARASRLYRKVYALVLKANLAAIEAAKPGVSGKTLDRIARRVIKEGGFGRCFGHSLGHGVGFDIHEHPVASTKSKSVLRAGMVLTIEPGVYLEGNLGVRIEDMVLITDSGCEVLSSTASK